MKRLLIIFVIFMFSLTAIFFFGLNIGDVNIKSFEDCKCQLYWEMTDEGCNDYKYKWDAKFSEEERLKWLDKAADWCIENGPIIYYKDSDGNFQLLKY